MTVGREKLNLENMANAEDEIDRDSVFVGSDIS